MTGMSFITQAQKAALCALGFTDEEIAKLTPEQGHVILMIDRAEAERFLKALNPSPEARFTFQSFDDSKQRKEERRKAKKKDLFARIRHGTLAQHWDELVKLNARGAGIYVCVNETNGKGRKKTNITRIRAVFVDLDGAPLDPVMSAEIEPDIVIESSPGRFHSYWKFAGEMPLDQFEPLQKALAARFNGDPEVFDLPRVLRLPGFIWRKGAPFRSRIISIKTNTPSATVAELVEIFRPGGMGEKPAAEPKPSPRHNGNGGEGDLSHQWRHLNTEALQHLYAWVPRIFPSAKRTTTGYRVSSADLGRDLEEDLSFHREGIKDFGIHDMGDPREGRRTPIDIVREYMRCDFATAVRYLTQCLGLDARQYLPSESPRPRTNGNGCGGAPPPNDIDFVWTHYEKPKARQCHHCGAIHPVDATKCNNCGAELGEEPPPNPGAKADYMLGKTKLACNVGNALLALRQEPAIMNAFAFDEMSRTPMLTRPLFVNDPDFKARPVKDEDVTKVLSWLQWFQFRRLGKNTMHEAITTYAREHAFHPVRDYLDRVATKWDGKPRISTWLTVYAGAPSTMQEDGTTGYVEEVGKMFLIGMVARIYRPGCKFDYMLILEGEQGLEKSKMGETLAGEEFFSDQLPDVTTKDASQHLRGKWLIEIAELHAYTRAQIDQFKAFISRKTERYRPPWGHNEVHEPRQCAFFGTTNKVRYLRDETGNRRQWPVMTGELNIKALERDRDQLWAEAVHLYRAGVHWWPDRVFEREHIVPQQEARFEPDPWEPLIKKYLQGKKRTTMLEIATNVLGFTTSNTQQTGQIKTPINRLDPKTQGRIGAVLHHLAWVPKHNEHDRWWEPGPNVKG
jgi:hypothetical protein